MRATRSNQNGNVFTALFGAVVLVGVVGFAVTNLMKGPLKTAVTVTRQNTAESQMAIAAQVAVMAANINNAGDCDSDGMIEPLEWKDPATTTPATVAPHFPINGGLLPDKVVANNIDPWGQLYGYCAWDHGTSILNVSCRSGASNRRLEGANSRAYPVVAVISSGPDKQFTTTCRNFSTGTGHADANNDGDLDDPGDSPLVSKANANDDDLIFSFTYEEAVGASGGLWSLKSSDQGTATIDKNIEALDATLSGTALFANIGAYTAGGGPADCTGLGSSFVNDSVTGNCFYKGSTSKTWSAAETACEADGAHLAVASTAHLDSVIDTLGHNMWLGMSDQTTEGKWVYTYGSEAGTQFWSGDQNGSAFGGNFTDWHSGEPNGGTGESCLVNDYFGDYEWADEGCGLTNTYVCQKDAIAGTASSGTAAPTSGLVGYWKFDAGSGSSAIDSSGYSNTGTLSNSPTWGGGKVSGALAFSAASSSRVRASASASLNNLNTLSACAWIKPSGSMTGSFIRVLGKLSTSSSSDWAGWGIYIDKAYGNLLSFYTRQYGWIETTAVMATDTWQHVCATWDGTNGTSGMKVYYNGAQAGVQYSGDDSGTSADFSSGGAFDDSSSPLNIGVNASTSEKFDGSIDEVRVYNRVLSASEVADVYNYTGIASSGGTQEDCAGLGSSYYNDPASKHCYFKGSSAASSYAAAKAACVAKGAYLATPTSADEMATIVANVDHSETLYIGLQDLDAEGTWKYDGGEMAGVPFWQGDGNTGTTVGGHYANWEGSSAEPNGSTGENCGATFKWGYGNYSGTWVDYPCSASEKYLCEKGGLNAADCSGLGASSYNDPTTGHCYYSSSTTAKGDDAQAACQANGAYLATPSTSTENSTILSHLNLSTSVSNGYYLGFGDPAVEGDIRWNGGELNGLLLWTGGPSGSAQNGFYTDWNGGDPDDANTGEDCGGYWYSGGGWRWATLPCDSTWGYVCEKSPSNSSDSAGVLSIENGIRLPLPATMPTCNSANTGVLRRNISGTTVELCNGTDWVAPSGGSSSATDKADCTGYGPSYYNDPESGHCYWTDETQTTYANHMAACKSKGGYLATPSTADENEIFDDHLTPPNGYWGMLGMSDVAVDGTWVYTAGEEKGRAFWIGDENGSGISGRYNHWASGEPNGGTGENCAVMADNTGHYWIDVDCNRTDWGAYCEKSPSTETPTIKAGADGLLGYWKFDENTGTVAGDFSGSNPGALHNGATWNTSTAKFTNALSLGGANNEGVSIPSNAAYDATQGTWAFWYKTSGNWDSDNPDSSNSAMLINRADATSSYNGVSVWLQSNNYLVVTISKANGEVAPFLSAAAPAGDNAWHHVAVEYNMANGGANKIYIDGVLKTTINSNAAWTFNSQPVTIGYSAEGFHEEFKGSIDDFRMYNRQLSADEVVILAGAQTCDGLGDVSYNDPTSGHCYFRLSNQTWTSGKTACTSNGGYIASITSTREAALVSNHIIGGSGSWTGGTDETVEGAWRWADGPLAGRLFWVGDNNGSLVSGAYNIWYSGEPNNNDGGGNRENCPVMNNDGAGWDAVCTNGAEVICEKGSALTTMPTSGMTNYWHLNEATGTTAADSVGSRTLTATSTTWSSGILGSAVSMSGSGSSYLGTTTLTGMPFGSSQNFTFGAWVYQTDQRSSSSFLYLSRSGCYLWIGADSDLGFHGECGGGTQLITDAQSNAIKTNKWQYLTVTLDFTKADAQKVKFYVNGVDVSSGSVFVNGAYTGFVPTSAHFGDTTYGAMDDIVLYNRALSAAEVTQLYNNAAGIEPTMSATGGGDPGDGDYSIDDLSDGIANNTKYNVFAGRQSGNPTVTGMRNTGFGIGTLHSLTTGNDNSAFGYNALNLLTTGSYNTAAGSNALRTLVSGNYNTAQGSHALENLGATGNHNTAAGAYALSQGTGNYNTAVGYQTLYSNNGGEYNTGLGYQALYSNTTGSYNTAAGSQAAYSNQTGSYNAVAGNKAMYGTVNASYNTVAGDSAQYAGTESAADCNGLGASYYNDATTGHCYYKSSAAANWFMAQAACQGNGGYLAVPSTSTENALLVAQFSPATPLWIGAADTVKEGKFTWKGGDDDETQFYQGPTAAPTTSGLVGYWKMDQSSGSSMPDSSGNANNATRGSTIYWEPTGGVFGGAADFGDNDNYATVPDANSLDLTSFTIAAWVNEYDNGWIMEKGNDGGTSAFNYYLFFDDDNILKCGFITGTTFHELQVHAPEIWESWKHVACTFDNTSHVMNIYNNGTVIATGYFPYTPSVNSTPLWIARSGNWNKGTISAYLDELRLYNRALSTAEIQNIVLATSPTAGVTAAAIPGMYSNWSASSPDDASNNEDCVIYDSTSTWNDKPCSSSYNYLCEKDKTSPHDITAIGYQSLKNNIAPFNTMVGNSSGLANTTGIYNTGVGYQVLTANTTGSFNTGAGDRALSTNVTGSNNTAVGMQALSTIKGDNNTGVGYQVMMSAGVSSQKNTAIGYQALKGGASADFSSNTALGYQSLTALTTGSSNTAIGDSTAPLITTGAYNTIAGYQAMKAATGASSRNTVAGDNALAGSAAINDSVAIGYQSLKAATGSNNTAVGYQSLLANTTGAGNTAVGYFALRVNTTGSNNTAIGYDSGPTTAALSNTTTVGNTAQTAASNAVVIGNSSVTVVAGSASPTSPSDRRLKKDIQPSDLGLEFIMSLKPVSYRLKDGNGRLDYGFIAQDIEKSLDGRITNMITRQNDKEGTYKFRYNDLIAPMVKAIQERQAIIDDLKRQIEELKSENFCTQEAPNGK